MYQCRKRADEYAMVLSASFANVDLACRHIDEFLQRQRLNRAFAVKLGAREIMNNAIVHGCGQDPGKSIAFRIYRQGGVLYLCCRDEGPGYDPSRRRAEAGERLSESGRGLAILYTYFDRVSFNAAGNEITLELKVGSAGNGGQGPALEGTLRGNA